MRNSNRISVFLMICSALALGLYQNCSGPSGFAPKLSSAQSDISSSGGGSGLGTDGMRYVSYGTCGTSSLAIVEQVEFSSDFKTGKQQVHNCLPVDSELNVANFTIPGGMQTPPIVIEKTSDVTFSFLTNPQRFTQLFCIDETETTSIVVFSGNVPTAMTAQVYENGVSLYSIPLPLTSGQSVPLTNGAYIFGDATSGKNAELDFSRGGVNTFAISDLGMKKISATCFETHGATASVSGATPSSTSANCQAGSYSGIWNGLYSGALNVFSVAGDGSFSGNVAFPQWTKPVSGSCQNGTINFTLPFYGENYSGVYTSTGAASGTYTYQGQIYTWNVNFTPAPTPTPAPAPVCQAGVYHIVWGPGVPTPSTTLTISNVAADGTLGGSISIQGSWTEAVSGQCQNGNIKFTLPVYSEEYVGIYSSTNEMSGTCTYQGLQYTWTAK